MTEKSDQTIQMLSDTVRRLIPKIYQIWTDVGYDSETQADYGINIVKHAEGLFSDMLNEAECQKTSRMQNLASLYKQTATLTKALDIKLALDCYKNESIIFQESILKKHLKDLDVLKEKRLEETRKLLEKEKDLCSLLGIEPKGLDTSIPSQDELNSFSNYLQMREVEIDGLKSHFKEMRKTIIEMMEEMRYKPSLDFERLVCDDHHSFIYSASNMKKLQELNEKITDQYESLKEQAEKKRQELITLYKYLDVPKKTCQEFLKQHSDFSIPTINSLTKEVNVYRELRMQNIGKCVLNLREELTNLWDLCKVSETERDAFRPFHVQTFTEDTLTLHELEVERMVAFYKENQEIFELLKKRQELWDQYRETLLRSEDPDRLNNRGGQLLIEEKIRNQYKKMLPKIMDQLTGLTNAYKRKYGKPFTIYGLTVADYVSEQESEHKFEMDQLKVERARQKEEKKSSKKTPLSTSRRTPGAGTSLRTVQTSIKRKNLATSPMSVSSKHPRLAQSENTRPTTLGSKVRRSGQMSRRRLLNSFNKKSPKKSPRTAKKTDAGSSDNSGVNSSKVVITQYEEFQEHLASRSELRSTLLSEANGCTRKPMKEPVKTPVKPSRKNYTPITPKLTPRSKPRASVRSPQFASTPRFTAAPINIEDEF